jgi:HAD superfamily hydrolase (TIGR01549 family)
MNVELVTFMASLRPRYKIATICNGGSREAMNRKFQFRERVDLMVFDEEEGVSKPDARIYQLTLVRLHVQPEEAVFVDDKVQNVEAAQRLGLHTVLFKATAQTIVDLRSLLFTLQ